MTITYDLKSTSAELKEAVRQLERARRIVRAELRQRDLAAASKFKSGMTATYVSTYKPAYIAGASIKIDRVFSGYVAGKLIVDANNRLTNKKANRRKNRFAWAHGTDLVDPFQDALSRTEAE